MKSKIAYWLIKNEPIITAAVVVTLALFVVGSVEVNQ